MNEDTERLFAVRLGPSPSPREWMLRVHPLEPWAESSREGWVELVQDAFVHLAVVGGLCGSNGNPLAPAFGGDMEVWEVNEWLEWRFGLLTIDPASVSFLLNLCDLAALNIAPVSVVDILAPHLLRSTEPADRPLPGRYPQLSFAVEEISAGGESLSIQVEFGQKLTGSHVSHISRLLLPWQTALFRGGFSLSALPPGESEVRPMDPPIIVVDDLYCWNYEVFGARSEAVDVFLNCLERIHWTVCPVRTVVVE